MKKLFIFAILSTTLIFQSCGPKEKQEVTATPNDSIVTATVIIDTIAGTKITEVELTSENVPLDKSTTVTKVTTKEPGKVVTQKTTETKVGEDTKVEVVTKVVVADEPKKVVVAETPVKVTVQAPASTSGWVVPSKYISMKNPTDPKVDASIGKSLFSLHCKSCHGAKGLGDGTKAKDLKGDLGDMSSSAFQKQTDGALFYKITFGRDDMPNFDKKLKNEEDRWLIVNYLRTLGK